ncbi:SOUL heme-binding protein [Haladaptatus litoreus]|uniref:SOUL heme-binding protein n=1 Tax=Haladaptatus litoreus TaxID=553468 RepID=A0A1N6WBH8_9EURY|nr:heme-binding protein [Haladaptatus litoreus]SIQ87372.1 SOUL heme-binding protein [Haladaptatus litoreus]
MPRTASTPAKLAVGTLAALGIAWVGWGVYIKRTTERVPYTTALTLNGVEIRRYPDTVVARTTADDGEEAFRRLFEYIDGGNQSQEDIPMTAPVTTEPDKIAMTAPVATEQSADGVRMAFFLPGEYTAEGAPKPETDEVTIEHVGARTLAVRPFSWYATSGRVERNQRRLFDTLAAHDLTPMGDPSLLRYDAPWTPPFMRRNEIAVELAE